MMISTMEESNKSRFWKLFLQNKPPSKMWIEGNRPQDFCEEYGWTDSALQIKQIYKNTYIDTWI